METVLLVDGKCHPNPAPVVRGDYLLTTTYIHGVTRWNDDFIVLLRRSIAVYRIHPMTRIGTFKIPELRYGGDIAVNQTSGDIFVPERYRGVWKIETRPARRLLRSAPRVSLLLRSASNLVTLSSVAKDDRILLLRGQRPTSYVDLYDEQGVLVASVKLPAFVREPCHALDTPRDSYLVSYGRSRNLVHGVCEVDAAGETLRLRRARPVPGARLSRPHGRRRRRSGPGGRPKTRPDRSAGCAAALGAVRRLRGEQRRLPRSSAAQLRRSTSVGCFRMQNAQ